MALFHSGWTCSAVRQVGGNGIHHRLVSDGRDVSALEGGCQSKTRSKMRVPRGGHPPNHAYLGMVE